MAKGPKLPAEYSHVRLADAARQLSRALGQPVTAAMLREDLAAGAPANRDGTLDLGRYAAWLVKEAGRAA